MPFVFLGVRLQGKKKKKKLKICELFFIRLCEVKSKLFRGFLFPVEIVIQTLYLED